MTEFTVSTDCQANWDFTMDKSLGLSVRVIFRAFLAFCHLPRVTKHVFISSTRMDSDINFIYVTDVLFKRFPAFK